MNAKQYMAEVAQMPCILCEHLGLGESPAEVHHLFSADRRSDWHVAPLCYEHHRGKLGVHGLRRRGFLRLYGITDEELHAMTRNQIQLENYI